MYKSNEYFGIKGSNYYLIDIDSDEGYSFSEFGKGVEFVNAKYVVAICRVLTKVNIFSILSDVNANICEVYYQGKRAIIQDSGMNVYKKIPLSFQKETFITFRILREECIGVSQILIPFKEGCVTLDMLSNLYGGITWK